MVDHVLCLRTRARGSGAERFPPSISAWPWPSAWSLYARGGAMQAVSQGLDQQDMPFICTEKTFPRFVKCRGYADIFPEALLEVLDRKADVHFRYLLHTPNIFVLTGWVI